MQATTQAGRPRPRVGERIMAAINRDPLTAPRALRNDAVLAVAAALVSTCLGLMGDPGLRPDALGWTLLYAAHVPLVWRRRHPVLVLLVVMALIGPYHALDNHHAAPIPVMVVVLYSVASTGTVRRTLVTGGALLGVGLVFNAVTNPDGLLELLRISGWIIAVLFFGIDVRYYRQYVAAIVERAERAERTREEEARRRVAEERLRIARDLHDLLAHSITLIGVQTSVAAHVLSADPERLDRAAIAAALDDIAGTCRSARGELRTTLEVLRAQDGGETRGPLPDLRGLGDLADSARLAGATVDLSVTADAVSPAVGAATYRIVQEALTNAVRHGGRDDLTVRVRVSGDSGVLRVTVTDDGAGSGTGTPGYGLVGMRERARSVGGALGAGPLSGGRGFEVSAVLPLGGDDGVAGPVESGESGGSVASVWPRGVVGGAGPVAKEGAR
ncbi:sensor histidine kinase [Streptomyces sp. NPDC059477]|uniref:sensor histidine kinase n=1 Tax=Streptomyces sp. NPDC059477 TaxID=3346847 RepID=UPI0036B3C806